MLIGQMPGPRTFIGAGDAAGEPKFQTVLSALDSLITFWFSINVDPGLVLLESNFNFMNFAHLIVGWV